MLSRRLLVLVGVLALPLASRAQQPTAPDTSWKTYLSFLATGSGIWLTSNDQYRTTDNGEPRWYGQRYWLGFGKTTLHGCLWGEYPDQRPVFWHFFMAWDPARRQFLMHQESGNGTIGLGTESPATSITEQVFTRPDGGSSATRHTNERHGADTLITRSFDREGDQWLARRTYTWTRKPAGTAAGC